MVTTDYLWWCSTVVNFIQMFKGDDRVEIIPIYLAYNDKLPDECRSYSNIRAIETKKIFDVSKIRRCINNLWIALDIYTILKLCLPI